MIMMILLKRLPITITTARTSEAVSSRILKRAIITDILMIDKVTINISMQNHEND
jgi:hypothetical protein